MNKKSVCFSHITALSILFVLGNGVIVFPLKGSDQFGFTAYLISLIFLLIVFPLVSKALEKIKLPRILCYIGLSSLAVASLFCAAQSFYELTEFATQVILPTTPEFFITVIFGFAVVYFVTRKKENIIKFSLVSGVLTVAAVLFFFIAPMENYDLRNIYIFRLPDASDLWEQLKPYLINPLLQSLLLPVYFKLAFKKVYIKEGTIGSVLGAMLLGLCVLSSILLFGADEAGNMSFPFSSAVSTVNVGRLFTRLDGFAYFVYFVCVLIKTAVCVSISVLSLKKISKGC